MKHHTLLYSTLTILTLGVMAAMLQSCDIETNDNGSLDGYWHLVQVDSIATGKSTSYAEETFFWAVQSKLLVVKNPSIGQSYLFHFTYSNNILHLSNPRENNRETGDAAVTDVQKLAPYGINAMEEQFTAETLNGRNMVLSSPSVRLHFVKF